MSAVMKALCSALAAGVLCASGCADGLFVAGAPPRARAELAMTSTTASDSALFESVDAIRVRITRQVGVLLDSTLAFRSAGAETHVRLAVELKSSQEAVVVDVELRAAGLAVFRGVASATLKRSENTVVSIPLTLAPAASVAAQRTRAARDRTG